MKKMRTLVVVAAVAAFPIASAIAGPRDTADRPSYTGKAQLVSSLERGSGASEIRVGLLVDLSKVTLAGQPAQLGAYVIKMTFDPAKVEYVGVAGGADQHFSQAPVATFAEKANNNGFVKLAAVLNAETGPVGLVSVGAAEFREKVNGGALSIHADLESLAAPAQATSGGRAAASPMIDVTKEAR